MQPALSHGKAKTRSQRGRQESQKGQKAQEEAESQEEETPQILTGEGVVMLNRIRWVLVVALALVLIYRLYQRGGRDDLVQRAISVCELCGLTEEEVLRFIDNKARSELSRAELFKSWEDTYDDP